MWRFLLRRNGERKKGKKKKREVVATQRCDKSNKDIPTKRLDGKSLGGVRRFVVVGFFYIVHQTTGSSEDGEERERRI